MVCVLYQYKLKLHEFQYIDVYNNGTDLLNYSKHNRHTMV